MDKSEIKQTSSSIDNVRRNLLKLEICSIPPVLLIGEASEAKASGGNKRDRIREKIREI